MLCLVTQIVYDVANDAFGLLDLSKKRTSDLKLVTENCKIQSLHVATTALPEEISVAKMVKGGRRANEWLLFSGHKWQIQRGKMRRWNQRTSDNLTSVKVRVLIMARLLPTEQINHGKKRN